MLSDWWSPKSRKSSALLINMRSQRCSINLLGWLSSLKTTFLKSKIFKQTGSLKVIYSLKKQINWLQILLQLSKTYSNNLPLHSIAMKKKFILCRVSSMTWKLRTLNLKCNRKPSETKQLKNCNRSKRIMRSSLQSWLNNQSHNQSQSHNPPPLRK